MHLAPGSDGLAFAIDCDAIECELKRQGTELADYFRGTKPLLQVCAKLSAKC